MNGASRERQLSHEVADWVASHLTGEFACLRHRGGPGDEEAWPELRKAWERELARGGWTGLGWPAEAGGRGFTVAEQVIFHEAYARAGGPGRMGHIGEGLLGPTLVACGTDDQRARFLPAILAGTQFWCQGYSEPGAGSDLANLRTRAAQEADGSWRVSGQKAWTSLARDADWIFVLARSDAGSRGSQGLSFLLMPLDQPGIEIRPIRQINGGAEFNEVFFDGARAGACDLVGAPGEGWRIAMTLLGFERGVSTLGQQMQFVRELEWVIDAARASGADREPVLRQRIGRAWAGLRVMRYNALRMLSGADGAAGAPLRREALIYKYQWSNWHRDLGQLAMDALGARANVIDPSDELLTRLQRLFLFSRADTIYAGTNEIQLNIMAERGLGMPREPRGQA
ncbi:acyl-CoA dehydrogenase family protein [Burkholderia sp. FERM BP-3421]|uniref:acyl-CoA dehydrogenase family protein n=1 Tax=Burkholderia sp. FERM BP-3421 TaxID=1494466 RepID=UPI0023620B0B|nr:acyl-CoA dehydrogenase family protein [Burkholderia sp. FERM BP-3421]WDD92164.1 acyl-CoA dehydrogenase family protein [Burkholderia sp. FERM BP-3421]